ncbi:MAG: response regulator [Caulobacteraceae bacterium]
MILIIEDDEITASALELFLKSERLPHPRRDSRRGSPRGGPKHYEYDAIMMDLNLPDMAGLEVLRKLRCEQGVDPGSGAVGPGGHGHQDQGPERRRPTDYLIKPANHAELAARLRAVVRRAKGHAQSYHPDRRPGR